MLRYLSALLSVFMTLATGPALAIEVLESKHITEGSSEYFMRVTRIFDAEQDCEYIKIVGYIPNNVGPAISMVRALPECNGRKMVYLDNGGGKTWGALRLAKFFKHNNVHTIVAERDECFSACTLMFMGGRKRTLEPYSELVFHAPFDPLSKNDSKPHCSSRHEKWYKRQVRELLGYSKNSSEIGKRAMAHCGFDAGWTPTIAEARELGLVTQ